LDGSERDWMGVKGIGWDLKGIGWDLKGIGWD